ncbi:MAG TPA: T9SS type A sorting domain-containing protein, partial [Cytophagaceae bacterium]
LKLESTNNVRIQVPALKSGVHRDSIYLGSSTILYGFTTPLCLSPENVYLVNSANEQIIRIEDFGTNKRYNDHFIYGYFSVNGTTVPGKYIPKNLDKNCHILFDTTNRYLEVLPPTLKTDIKSYRGYTGQKGLSIPLNNLHDLLDKGCFNLADIKIKHTSTNFIVTPKSVIAKDQWTHEMTFDIPLSADTGKYGLHIRYDTLKCNVYKDETDIFITPPYFVGIVQCGEIDFTKPSVCAVVNDTVNIGISGNEFQDSLYYPKAEYFQLKNLISNKVIPAFNVREDRYSPSIQFLSHNAEPGQYELQVNYPGKRVMVIPLVVAIAPPKIDLLTGYSFDQKNSIYSFEDRKDTLHVYAAGFNFKDPEDCFFLDSLKVYLFDSTTNAKIFPDKLLYKNHREFDFVFTSNEDHDNISFRLIFEGAQCRVQCRTKVIIQKRTEYYYHTNLQKGRTSWFSLSLRSHDFTDITSCYYTKVGMATIVDSLGNKYAALDSFEPSGSSIRPQEMTFDVKIPDNLDLSKKYFFNYRTPAECVLGSFRVPISISPPVFSTDTLAYKPYLAVKVYSDSSFLNPKSCFYPTKGNTILATKDSLNKSITYQADSIRFLPKALNPYYEYFTAYFTIPSDDPEFRYQAHATIARQKHTLISGSGNCRFNADVWVMSRGININKKSLNPAVKEFVSVKGISTDFTNKNSCTYISNNVKLKHIYLPLEIVPEKVTVLSEHFFQMQIAPQPERVGGFYNVVVSDSSSTCRLVSDSMIYLAKGQDVATYMTVLSRSRPQRDVIYQVDLKNNGTETMSGTNVLSYSQAQLSYKSITGIQGFSYPDSIVVPYKDLLPGANFSYRITFKVNASLGDSIKVISKVGPLEKDVFLTDNTYHLKQLVTGSFDPNDKQVYPESDISPTEITDGLDLVYTIRFQNMGNDTAFLIIVKDVINPLLEINSFEMISSSHPFDLSVKDRTMTWTFDNVLLPDNKTNEPGSHGFIKFKIKPKKNISLGDEINNNAAIYFDTNPPVVTNSTKNTVQVVVNGIAKPIKRDVSIYPNPVNRELFIVPSSHDEKLVAIKIYNTLGKELILGYSIDLENNRIVFNNIPTGFYMIKATTGINTYFKTFIIER